MRTFLAFFLCASAVPTLAAQNFVQNGDFSQGLQPWSMTGYADMPQVENFDTSGLATSAAFACSPGNNTTPPLTLSQQVLVVPGVPLEFYADAASLSATASNDGGTIDVSLAGQPLLSYPFGRVAPGITRRGILCARFTSNLSGLQKLDLTFSRVFTAQFGVTPRVYVDNVALRVEIGPTFCLRGERTLGSGAALEVLGEPNAAFAVFLSGKLSTGLQVPGVGGIWWLDPPTTMFWLSGAVDAGGQWVQKITLPNDLALDQVSLWFQALQVTPALAVSVGEPHNYGLHQ